MVGVVVADLVNEAKAGSELAFEALLAPAMQPAFRLACGILHDPDSAEDAVQEAALKAWRKINRLRQDSPFAPWFLGIVTRQCLSLRRQRWWRVVKVADLNVSNTTPDQGGSAADLRRALMRLRSRERAVVVLYFFLDLPIEQIAAITGASDAAVRGRLHRAVKRLRPDLELEESLR